MVAEMVGFCAAFGNVVHRVAVVQVQTDECEQDTGGLGGSGGGSEPKDCDDDDPDSLDQGGDGVGDWGEQGEEDEGEDVLAKVEESVEEEFDHQCAVVKGAAAGGEVDGAGEEEFVGYREAFGKQPDGCGEDEGTARTVAEEIELIEFAAFSYGFGAGGFVEEFFGKDILSDEDDGGDEGASDTDKVGGEVGGAG